MAESTLSLKVAAIKSEVGEYLGYGPGAANGGPTWNAKQQYDIDSAVRSGLSQFYTPAPTPAWPSSYKWSFLVPTASLTLALAASTVDLPDDYMGLEGQITVGTAGGETGFWPINFVGEGTVRQQHASLPSATGRPTMIAERPLRGTSLTEGQRFQLYVFPTADQAYVLTLRYILLPNALTDARPYAYGGGQHSETIVAACIAAAELYRDNERGPRYAYFQERLAASIARDSDNKPDKGGYNADRSDGLLVRRDSRHGWPTPILRNGVEYGG